MYRLFKSQRYLEYMEDYHVNSLLAKVFDYMDMDADKYYQLFSNEPIFYDFSLFSESEMVIERIQEALENDEKICIYGDYDCDGILATTILVYAFEKLGKKVGYHIPHRHDDGYGLNVKRVEQMAQKGYSLIITVDNGVKAFEAIDKANELGIDVIVTDHHSFEEDLPEAFAIIHTKISPDYPYKEISGGMVAYKLACALLEEDDPYLKCLAALTTISDMMPLLDENRSIVKEALPLLNKHQYPCIDLLLGNQKDYSATSIAFNIVPKINSFGRLPEYIHPVHVVRYFLSQIHQDKEFMMKFASEASRMNTLRSNLTTKQYALLNKQLNEHEPLVYLSSPEVHEGIVGLIAAKMNREHHKVAFIMHYDQEKQMHKGSVRSLEGFKVNEVFEKLSSYLEVYGGHALAGGFSVSNKNYLPFKQALMTIYKEYEKEIVKDEILDVIDVDLNELTKENVSSLSFLEPFGQMVEEPLFALRNVNIKKVSVLSNGKHLKIETEQGIQGLFFNKGHLFNEFKDIKRMNLVGNLQINRYLNQVQISLLIKDIV